MAHAMRAGGGKQKGAQFERDVCVELSKWVTFGQREDVFWRSAMSGGRATVAAKAGKKHSAQVGDISCIHHSGSKFGDAFAVECKFYSDLNYTGLLTGKGKLLDFWKEICLQALTHDKFPFLVARQNRMKSMVCLNSDGLDLLGLSYSDFILISPPLDLNILELSSFVGLCTPFV